MREFNRLIPALEHMGYGIRQTTRGRGREARKIVEIWRKSSMPDPSPNGSVGRSAGSAACLSGEGTMQGYENGSQNSLDKGNSLVSPNGSAASVASFREKGSKNSKGRKKAHRRINTIKARKMPSDAADQPSRNGKSPAKAQENGLPRDSENAVRHPADHEPDATDRPSPGGRFDQLPADAQAAYWRARDAGAIHYDALVVAIDYDENRNGLREQ